MADLVITAANVVPDAGFGWSDGTAGEAITQGQPVYLKAADDRYWKADNNVTAAEAAVVGIALNAASAGQPLRVMTSGTITIGAVVVVGEIYIVSATAGGIAPIADISTNFVTLLGIATTAAKIQLNIQATGIQHA